MSLSPKEKKFCQEYIVDLNGAQAAIRAGYSERSAKEQAARMLTKANIKKFVKELKDERAKRTEITADMVVKELAKIGFANIQDYISGDNAISDISQIDAGKAAAVAAVKKSVTRFDGGEKEVVEFKLWNKVDALEKLGRHLGIFEKDNLQNKPDSEIRVIRTIISKKV